jgi:WD40 repeat protein
MSPSGQSSFAGGLIRGQDERLDGAVVAYAASDGAELWRHRVSGSPVFGVAASRDGKVFAIGENAREDTHELVALRAESGELLWNRVRSDRAGSGSGHPWGLKLSHVRVSPDSSTVFLARSARGVDDDSDIAVEAFEAEHGAFLWSSRYDEATEAVSDLALSADGSALIVIGYSAGVDAWKVLRYRATDGALEWAYTFANGGLSIAHAVALSPDSKTVAVTGNESVLASYGTNSNIRTTTLDAETGTEKWTRIYDGLVGGAYDDAYGVTFSRDGDRVLVTGSTAGNNWVTISYNAATGFEEWVASPPSTTFGEYPWAIGTSPDSRLVYVAGESNGAFDIRAYDVSSGLLAWIGRDADLPLLGGRAFDLAVGPDGSAYITGARTDDIDMLTYAFGGSASR